MFGLVLEEREDLLLAVLPPFFLQGDEGTQTRADALLRKIVKLGQLNLESCVNGDEGLSSVLELWVDLFFALQCLLIFQVGLQTLLSLIHELLRPAVQAPQLDDYVLHLRANSAFLE